MKTFLASVFLVYSMSTMAEGIPNGFRQIDYVCHMACGVPEQGFNTCKGVQLGGSLMMDANGNWYSNQTEFIFSPDGFEFSESIYCVSVGPAEVKVLDANNIQLNFGQAYYRSPQVCADGTVIDWKDLIGTQQFRVLAKYTGKPTSKSFATTTTVWRTTIWPKKDFDPTCELDFK